MLPPPPRFAAALQEASQVDKLIEEEKGGEEVLADRLPLLGVPLSVKESYALQGTVRGSGGSWGVYRRPDTPPERSRWADRGTEGLLPL